MFGGETLKWNVPFFLTGINSKIKLANLKCPKVENGSWFLDANTFPYVVPCREVQVQDLRKEARPFVGREVRLAMLSRFHGWIMINHDSSRIFEVQCHNLVDLISPRICLKWTAHAASTVGGVFLVILIGTMMINQDILGHVFQIHVGKVQPQLTKFKNEIWTQLLVYRIYVSGIRRFKRVRYALPKHYPWAWSFPQHQSIYLELHGNPIHDAEMTIPHSSPQQKKSSPCSKAMNSPVRGFPIQIIKPMVQQVAAAETQKLEAHNAWAMAQSKWREFFPLKNGGSCHTGSYVMLCKRLPEGKDFLAFWGNFIELLMSGKLWDLQGISMELDGISWNVWLPSGSLLRSYGTWPFMILKPSRKGCNWSIFQSKLWNYQRVITVHPHSYRFIYIYIYVYTKDIHRYAHRYVHSRVYRMCPGAVTVTTPGQDKRYHSYHFISTCIRSILCIAGPSKYPSKTCKSM